MLNKLKQLIIPVIIFVLLFSLSASADMEGSGTSGDPYIITNATDLKNVENDMSAYYELANDIDLDGDNFEPIGYASWLGFTSFTGHFDGKGYKIYNGSIGSEGVDYSSDNYIGIFARNNGTISNVGSEIDVSGNYYTGGLVGYNYDTIQNCYASGSVSGTNNIGGLVGENRGTIQNCYATGSVSGNSRVGGLVGYNYQAKIVYSYSTGKPSGISSVGGFCGYRTTGGNYEDTENYWDTDTSETTSSAMGTGKTTTQMKDIDTFVGNWDMVAIGDYVDEDWFIDDGNDYPRLGWEWEVLDVVNVLFLFSNF